MYAASRLLAHVERWRTDAPTQRILLRTDGNSGFCAGQYLTLVHPDGEHIPFSIASPPAVLPHIELHYRPTDGHIHSQLMAELARATTLTMEMPFGSVTPRPIDPRPLVCVAEETGMSQVASVLTDFASRKSERACSVLWAAASGDFYFADELRQLGVHTRLLRQADVIDALQDMPLASAEFLLCGSPDWVYRHVDWLTANGVAAQQLQSDVFSYAPRT